MFAEGCRQKGRTIRFVLLRYEISIIYFSFLFSRDKTANEH